MIWLNINIRTGHVMEHLNIVQVCITNYTQYIDNSILIHSLTSRKMSRVFRFFYIVKNLTTDIRS